MRDPYLYENSSILKNKLDIRTQEELDDAEADYVVIIDSGKIVGKGNIFQRGTIREGKCSNGLKS